jgi:CRP-like cAMP-binding protein
MFINSFPRYNKVFIEGMAKWLIRSNKKLEYLNQNSSKQKYELMCRMEPNIIKRVSLKDIASYLGITQETLSRIRGKKN